MRGAAIVYLIRWEGYGIDDDTWEPEENIVGGAARMLAEWKAGKADIEKNIREWQTGRR